MSGESFDAVVVGSGPNGLMAALRLARAGRSVVVLEAAGTVGGGLRSAALTRPGFVHDICSAIHPLGLASPAFRDARLEEHGLRWLHPDAPFAHPLDDGRAAVQERSIAATAESLGADGPAYRKLFTPVVEHGDALVAGMLSPLSVPRSPFALARFGLTAIRSVRSVAEARFAGDIARAMLAGIGAHAMLPLESAGTAGYSLFLGMLGHLVGWPMAAGGSQAIADALVASLVAHGGEVRTGHEVTSMRPGEIPDSRVVLFDVTPRQLLRIAGDRLPNRYARTLRRFRYGPGVFKIDWALDGPVPWKASEVARAATVHLGGTLDEIAASERAVERGLHAERPYAIFVQPSAFDPSRAPTGDHTGWAYCHVPNGSEVDMREAIEAQVERFAPGFRDLITDRHVMGPAAVEAHDANYVGGDIGGGAGDIRQLFTRPNVSLHPWRTPAAGIYLCSSSTPPGPGVHGMCGWHAAGSALGHELR